MVFNKDGQEQDTHSQIIFDAYWVDGYINGFGRCIWNDGNWYEGNHRDGSLNGEGVYHIKNGNWYQGCWKNAKKDGFGTLHRADGTNLSEYWKEDEYVG